MASAAQIAANRANARKSTGPKTAEGKARSSMNAVKHGLAAHRTTLPHEDPAAYDEHRAAVIADCAPADAQEMLLVDAIAQASWCMKRSDRFEAALFNNQIEYAKQQRDLPTAVHPLDDRMCAIALNSPTSELGFKTLFRYAGRAESKFFRAVEALRKLQNDRFRREAQLERTIARQSPEPPGPQPVSPQPRQPQPAAPKPAPAPAPARPVAPPPAVLPVEPVATPAEPSPRRL
jgi:hypothetical protein